MSAIDVFGPANLTGSTTTRPFDGRQFGTSDTWFQDCSSPETDDGTDIGAAWLNQIVASHRAVARANGTRLDGITPVVPQDNTDGMLLAAIQALIQRGQQNFAIDTGTTNAIIINPPISPAEIVAGMPFMVQVAKAPSGPTTMRVAGFSPGAVRKSGNAPLTGGDWADGDMVLFCWDGSFFKQIGAGTANTPQLIIADLTMTVPEQYPSIRAALLASSSMMLRSDAHLRILVDADGYEETFDTSLGPLVGNHPYGQRISIEALQINIGFPSGDDVEGKSASDTLTMLKSRFRGRIHATGGANALEIRAGTLNLSNFLIYGDGSAGSYGAMVGNWQTTASSGSLGLNNVAVHGFAQDNIQATDNSVIRLNNVCSTYAGVAALRAARASNLTIRTGSLVGMYSAVGLACARGGIFAADAGASRLDFRRNTQFGIQSTLKGSAGMVAGPAVYIKNNDVGAQGFDGDVLGVSTAVLSGNRLDLYAAENGLCDFKGASVSTTSPARNVFGNNNGICLV